MSRYARMHKPIISLILLMLMVPFAFAAEKTHYDRVQLSAQAVAEVENDTLVAVLAAQRKGENYSGLADEVNRVVTQAVKEAKQVKAIEVQTLDYQTGPVYEKQHQTGWQVSQSIQLKSRDSGALGKLLGQLQNRMILVSMAYAVSPEQRQRVQEKLIAKAIAAFDNRAKGITQALHRKRYRLVNMRVETGGDARQPLRMHSFAQTSASSAPAIEAGSQRITVTVSGEIELELN